MNIYWKLRLWLIEIAGRWNQFKFNCAQRGKSTWYSIKVMSWHKPCIECWGSKVSVKYWQEQPCRMGCGVGFQKIHFWLDMEDMFYPSHLIYRFQCWFKHIAYGCKRNMNIWHFYCVHGTCGCEKHPLTHDWAGQPLDTSKKK